MEQQHSQACIWCCAPDYAEMNFRAYISIPAPDWANTANEDISHCMDCVKIYHRGRAAIVAEKPDIEQALFPTEVQRLRCSLDKCLVDLSTEHEDVFDSDSDDACNEEEQMFDNYWENSQQEGCPLPVPIQEILWFPFYLQDEDVNETFCHLMKVLQRTDPLVTAVDKPLIGLFMLLIHPDIRISNWANKSVAHLGNHAIESYEQFTHAITLMLSVISFGLFDNRTLSSSCGEAPSAWPILSSHLFPHQQLDYWQGLSCLLCWISEENMNHLGSELHSNITRIYSATLEFETDDEHKSFWPKLLGFQQLIDKLGFRIWQYLNDAPDVIFNSIFNHPSVRSAVNHLKMRNTKSEHQPLNRVHETTPYAWIISFGSSLLEYDSLAKHCVTMVLDILTNEMNEALNNQMKTASNQPIVNEEPSLYIQHSVSILVEILESLITYNLLCVSLSCFEKCLNILVLFLTKFMQQQGSSQQITSWQSSPLRFIRNLLNICVKKKISLPESQRLIKDIDSCTNFMDVEQNVLNMCIQNLVGHLHFMRIEDTVKVYNGEGASTSAVSEDNKYDCTGTFKPYDDFPEQSSDYMFEDSSITCNVVVDESIVISSDSEDEFPEGTGVLDDRVIDKKGCKSLIKEEIPDNDLHESRSPDLDFIESLENDKLRGLCNDEATKEQNEDYCTCPFEPFVSIKKEISDNNVSDPSLSKNIDEVLDDSMIDKKGCKPLIKEEISENDLHESGSQDLDFIESLENDKLVGVCNDEEAKEQNEDYCTCPFEPFVSIKKEISDNNVSDPSLSKNIDEVLDDSMIDKMGCKPLIKEEISENDLHESGSQDLDFIESLENDKLRGVCNDKEAKEQNEDYFTCPFEPFVSIKKEVSDNNFSDPSLSKNTDEEDITPDTEQEISSYTAQETLEYTAPDSEQENSSYTAQDVTLKYTAPDSSYKAQDALEYTAPDSEQENSSYTAQDTLKYTVQNTTPHSAPYVELDTVPYSSQDSKPNAEQDTPPDCLQDNLPHTVMDNSSDTLSNDVPETDKDTAPHILDTGVSRLRELILISKENMKKRHQIEQHAGEAKKSRQTTRLQKKDRTVGLTTSAVDLNSTSKSTSKLVGSDSKVESGSNDVGGSATPASKWSLHRLRNSLKTSEKKPMNLSKFIKAQDAKRAKKNTGSTECQTVSQPISEMNSLLLQDSSTNYVRAAPLDPPDTAQDVIPCTAPVSIKDTAPVTVQEAFVQDIVKKTAANTIPVTEESIPYTIQDTVSDIKVSNASATSSDDVPRNTKGITPHNSSPYKFSLDKLRDSLKMAEKKTININEFIKLQTAKRAKESKQNESVTEGWTVNQTSVVDCVSKNSPILTPTTTEQCPCSDSNGNLSSIDVCNTNTEADLTSPSSVKNTKSKVNWRQSHIKTSEQRQKAETLTTPVSKSDSPIDKQVASEKHANSLRSTTATQIENILGPHENLPVPEKSMVEAADRSNQQITYNIVQDALPDTVQLAVPGTVQDAAPDTVKDAVPDTVQDAAPNTVQEAVIGQDATPDTVQDSTTGRSTYTAKYVAPDTVKGTFLYTIKCVLPDTASDTAESIALDSVQDNVTDPIKEVAPNTATDTEQINLPYIVNNSVREAAPYTMPDTVEKITSGHPYMYTPERIQDIKNASAEKINETEKKLIKVRGSAAPNTRPDDVEETTTGHPYVYTPERVQDIKNASAEKISELNKLIKVKTNRVKESDVKKSLFPIFKNSDFDKPVPTASSTSHSDSDAKIQTLTNGPTVVEREQRQAVVTLNLPTNKSLTLNTDPSIDEQNASKMQDNPPITDEVRQTENMSPVQAGHGPHKTLSVFSANRPHQQRNPKTCQIAAELQTNLVSVTQQKALATCSRTTAVSIETSSSKSTAVKRQCNRIINLDQLVAIVLSWDPMWLDKQDFTIDDIIRMDHYVKPDRFDGKLKSGLKEVPLKFDSIHSYIKVFVPLLCLETWHYVLHEYKMNKRNEGNYVRMDHVLMSGCFLTCKRKIFSKESERKYPRKEDLVILSLNRTTSGQKFPSYRVFAIVTKTEIKGKASQEISMLEVTLQVKVTPQKERKLKAYIQENRNIQIQVVTSMVSRLQLFMCFKILQKHLLSGDILFPKVPPVPQMIASPQPSNLITKLDECQSEAADNIFTCMEMELMVPSISLLHGPPGTGKTRTIINIIERILKKTQPADNTMLLPNQKTINMENRPRILACAPSIIAVDRLMLKVAEMCLKDHIGEHNPKFNCGSYNIVRVGNSVDNRCMRYQLSTIVDKQMKQTNDVANNREDIRMLKEIAVCQKEYDKAIIRCGCLKFSSEASPAERKQAEDDRDCLEKQFNDLKKKRGEKIVSLCKERMEESIIKRADIIFCTLNGSGSACLNTLKTSRHPHFKYVIIDEACQCTELDTLIPLQFKGSKLLLVGDPQQLTATVLSEKAKKFGFQQSLFERMYTHFRNLTLQRNPVHLLRTQYRMHPEICRFPSKQFYNNELETSLSGSTKKIYDAFPFRPYLLFDIEDGRSSTDKDIINKTECQMVSALVSLLVAVEKFRIGIITPCKQHKILMEKNIKRLTKTNEVIGKNVEISTVDGFQGHEKDVIILFCAVTRGSSIGFVGDRNKMNVALTRAKMALYIVGHFRTLQKNNDWGELLRDAEQRKLVLPVRAGQYDKVAKLCKKDPRPPDGKITRESSFDKEAKGTGKFFEEGDGQGKSQAKRARKEERVLEESTSVKNIKKKINKEDKERVIGSKGHSQEPSESRDLPSSSKNVGYKNGKDAKNLREVIKAVNLKHPHGPLVKEITGLPPNPALKQGKSRSNIGDKQSKRQKRTVSYGVGKMQQYTVDTQGVQPLEERKKHNSCGSLQPSLMQGHGDVTCGIQEGEPVQKRKRYSSGGDLETRPRNERSVNTVNQEWHGTQRNRSSTTTTTTVAEPKLQPLQRGKKRIAHQPRRHPSGPTSSDLASGGQTPKTYRNEGFQIEASRPTQSTCPSARPVRPVSFSTDLTQVRIFEKNDKLDIND